MLAVNAMVKSNQVWERNLDRAGSYGGVGRSAPTCVD